MKGQVTIFLSLVLLTLLSILCSIFEFSRQRVLAFYLDCGVSATTESCLAGYQRDLWESYGVFSMYDDGRIEAFMEENLNVYGSGGQNWYPFRVTNVGFFPTTGLCDNHGEAFRQMAAAYMKAGLGDGKTPFSEDGKNLIFKGAELVKQAEEAFGSFTVKIEKPPEKEEMTEEDREIQEKQGVLTSVLDKMRNLKNSAVSTLVFPGVEFSDREIEPVRDEKAQENGGKLKLIDGILFKEYLREKFPTLLTDAKGYDLEYILGSHTSDKENLCEIAEKLLLIREGVNLWYLANSELRQTELDVAAVLLAAFTGQPELVGAVKYFLMLCWAFAEAVCDVKALVNGGKVPLQKNNRNWHTDLESLLFGDGELTASGSDTGMSYEDYLNVLLVAADEEKTALRALEVMQWRIRQVSKGFLITRCVTEAEYDIRIEAKTFFQTIFMREKRITLTRTGVLKYD